MRLTVDQALFDTLIIKAEDLGYDVYPTLPPVEAPYPFVRVGSVQRLPKHNKSRSTGRYAVEIAIWGIEQKRFEVSEMSGHLWEALLEFEVEGIPFVMDLGASTNDLRLVEESPKLKLWRAQLSLELDIY